ncbi:hypothetical protein CWRG_01666 [Chthonomonas calidirosea]|nr:hypothetical protein CWRG_01666 [Chthonomonas calidirosea]
MGLVGSAPSSLYSTFAPIFSQKGRFPVSLPFPLSKKIALPYGKQVVVRPLNQLQRHDARFKADIYAMEQILAWAAGQPRESLLKAEFASMPTAQQQAYLVQAIQEALQIEAEEKFPPPPPPIRSQEAGESANALESFAQKVRAWQEAKRRAEAERQAWLTQRLGEERKRVEALEAEKRLDNCCHCWRERLYREAFTMRFLLEALVWAVRIAENPQDRYFHDAEEVADSDDTTLEILIKTYLEIDGVRESEVPT